MSGRADAGGWTQREGVRESPVSAFGFEHPLPLPGAHDVMGGCDSLCSGTKAVFPDPAHAIPHPHAHPHPHHRAPGQTSMAAAPAACRCCASSPAAPSALALRRQWHLGAAPLHRLEAPALHPCHRLAPQQRRQPQGRSRQANALRPPPALSDAVSALLEVRHHPSGGGTLGRDASAGTDRHRSPRRT